MITADLVAIIIIALSCLLGLWLGFGKALSFFTRGIIGFIISILICYSFGGFFLQIDFVYNFVTGLGQTMSDKGGFFEILATIHFEVIVYYVVLFIIVTIMRIMIVKIIKMIVEINNVVIKIINKIFGMVIFVGVTILITILVFQVIYAIGGTIAANFGAKLEGSIFGLDKVYNENPFMTLIEIFKIVYVKTEVIPMT